MFWYIHFGNKYNVKLNLKLSKKIILVLKWINLKKIMSEGDVQLIFSDPQDNCQQCRKKYGKKGTELGRVIFLSCGHPMCYECAKKHVDYSSPAARCYECNIIIMGWIPVHKNDFIVVSKYEFEGGWDTYADNRLINVNK